MQKIKLQENNQIDFSELITLSYNKGYIEEILAPALCGQKTNMMIQI